MNYLVLYVTFRGNPTVKEMIVDPHNFRILQAFDKEGSCQILRSEKHYGKTPITELCKDIVVKENQY